MTYGEKLESLLLDIIGNDETKTEAERTELAATVSDDFSDQRLLAELAAMKRNLATLEIESGMV